MEEATSNDLVSVFQLLGIPETLRRSYENLGLSRLYDWQRECLFSTNVLRGGNLVYCAPTSGGKTLVAELVLLKSVVALRKKAIFVLPYVSLVVEKEKHLKRIVTIYNRSVDPAQRLKVRGFHGDKGGSKSLREHIFVCTIEKANAIVNTLLLRGRERDIGAVVLDETHVLGSAMNGPLLEILITKLKQLQPHNTATDENNMSNNINSNNNNNVMQRERVSTHAQIIALSATMGNVQELAHWLRARLFITHFRPVPLREFLKVGENILSPEGTPLRTLSFSPAHTNTRTLPHKPVHTAAQEKDKARERDKDGLSLLCAEGLAKGQQVLVFCPTKIATQQNALLLAEILGFSSHNALSVREALQEERNTLVRDLTADTLTPRSIHNTAPPTSSSSLDEQLQRCVLQGVAFHHSGLSAAQRERIESAFRAGTLSLLCATTTLAAGVNLPAGRVLIHSLSLGRESLGVAQYRQMCGRAGRAGQADEGESFLVVRAHEREKALALVSAQMPCVESQMHPDKDDGASLLKAIVEAIGLGLCRDRRSLAVFLQDTLLLHQLSLQDKHAYQELHSLVGATLRFLVEMRIVEEAISPVAPSSSVSSVSPVMTSASLSLTKLGQGMLAANLDPDEAVVLFDALSRAQRGLSLETALHLLFLVAPLDHALRVDFRALSKIHDALQKKPSSAAMLAAVGVSGEELVRWSAFPPSAADLEICGRAVRLSGVSEFFQAQRRRRQKSATASGSASVTAPSRNTSFKSADVLFSLCAAKRLWAALALQSLLDGVDPLRMCAQLSCSPSDMQALQRSARIAAVKTEKFCAAMGWQTMKRLLKDFKDQLDLSPPKEMRALLAVPQMPRRVALVLLEAGITTPQQMLRCEVGQIVQLLQLFMGFELQTVSAVDATFNVDTESAPSLSTDATLTRDEQVQRRFHALLMNLFRSAREFLELPQPATDEEKEEEGENSERGSDTESESSQASVHSSTCDEDDWGSEEDEEEKECNGEGVNNNSNIEEECTYNAYNMNFEKEMSMKTRRRSEDEFKRDQEEGQANNNDNMNNNNHPRDMNPAINSKGYPVSFTVESKAEPLSQRQDLNLLPSAAPVCAPVAARATSSFAVSSLQTNPTPAPSLRVRVPVSSSSSSSSSVSVSTLPSAKNDLSVPLNSTAVRSSFQPSPVDLSRATGCAPAVMSTTAAANANPTPLRPAKPNVNGVVYTMPTVSAINTVSQTRTVSAANTADAGAATSIVHPPAPVPSSSHSFSSLPSSSSSSLCAESAVHHVSITPLRSREGEQATAVEALVSDDELLRLMEELEARGIVAQESQPQIHTATNKPHAYTGAHTHADSRLSPLAHNSPHTDTTTCSYVPLPTPTHAEGDNEHMCDDVSVRESACDLTVLRESERVFAARPLSVSVSSLTPARPSRNTAVQLAADAQGGLCESVCESEDVEDDLLCAMMDEWERAQRTDTHTDDNTTHNDTTETNSSALSPMHTHTHSHQLTRTHPHTQTGRRVRPRLSPLITPFTASKLRSPGCFLSLSRGLQRLQALPSLAHSPHTTHSTSDRLIIAETVHASRGSLRGVLSLSVCDLRRDITGCARFLDQLRRASCLSFECATRSLPKSFLERDYGQYYESHRPTHGERNKERESWAALVSRHATSVSVACGETAVRFLELRTHSLSAREMARSAPQVLCGVAFNFGNKESFFLSLPQPLPLLPLPSSQTQSERVSRSASLSTLPLNVKERIALFVGFQSILSRSPHLLRLLSDTHTHTYTHADTPRVSEASNPLLALSREWCAIARRALLIQWRAGHAIEWRVLQRVLQREDLTKVAANVKSQAVLLRERDVLLSSPLADPAIALSLLSVTAPRVAESERDALKTVSLPQSLLSFPSSSFPKQQALEKNAGESVMERERKRHRMRTVSGFRAWLAMQSMSRLEERLQSEHQLSLFREVEMPLSLCCAEMEVCGVCVDASLLSSLRQRLKDRQLVVEFFLQSVLGRDFNVDCVKDVNALRARLRSELLRDQTMSSSSSSLTERQGVSHEKNQQQGQARVRSDWSAGKIVEEHGEEHANHAQDDPQIAEALAAHPLLRLVSEHRRHTRAIPLLSSVLGARRFSRVRAAVQQLGAETGRLIVTSPPLQQIPHECDFVPGERPTLHEELRQWISQCGGKGAAVNSLNSRLRTEREDAEWVQLDRCASITNSLVSDGNSKTNGNNNTNGFLGELLCVLTRTVRERFVMVSSHEDVAALRKGDTRAHIAQSTESLATQYARLGHRYTERDSEQVLQAIVELSASASSSLPTALTAVSHTHTGALLVVIPTDLVRRLRAGLAPHPAEFDLMRSLSLSTSSSRLALSAAKQERFSATQSGLREIVPVRRAFVAAPGYLLLAADYSQIELRILAHLCEDAALLAAFRAEEDVFRSLAGAWRDKAQSEVSTDERNAVKQLCYAIIYGAGPGLIAEQLKVTVGKAKTLLEDFLLRFPRISEFVRRARMQSEEQGFSETLLGRRRWLADIRSTVFKLRARAQRQAVNSICQGSAADLIKLAMVNIQSELERLSEKSRTSPSTARFHFRSPRSCPGGALYRTLDDARLVLQIHDELVYEVREEELLTVARIVKDCMESAVSLKVPLRVKLSAGKTWADLEAIDLPPSQPFEFRESEEDALENINVAKKLFD